MLELKRILWNRKTLLLFGILILLHGVFFFFQCNEQKAITLTGEELEAYVEGYPAYIQSVQDNVVMMKENPLFSADDSFVYRNLMKTGEDYAVLADVVPVVGENRGVIAVLNFNLTGFILLLVGVYIVLCFLSERQKGLYLMVRCTERGRSILSLQRIGILCLGVFAAAAVLFVSIWMIAGAVFPGSDMSRPIQSVPEFESIIGHYSIGGYAALYLLRKAVGCLFACLLLYFCMSLFRSAVCIVMFFLLMLGEYALYAFIIPTGKWSALKFINLYTYAFCGTEYATYYNLNLFGKPCNIVACSDLFVAVGTALLVVVCLLQYARQYPRSEYRTLKIVEKLRVFFSKHKPTLSLTAWELKKVLLSQKGLFVFVLLVYLAYSASVESNYMDFRSKYVTMWYTEFAGELDDAKMTVIRDKKTELEEKIARLELSVQQQNESLMKHLMNGNNEGAQMVQQLINKLQDAIRETNLELTGLTVVLEQAEDSYAYSKRTGNRVMLIDAGAYELLFHNDKQTILRNHLYSLLMIVLMMSGIMACEKTSNMENILHTAYRGRGRILLRKVGIMLSVSIIGTLAIHLVQYVQIDKVFAFANKEVLVQSVPCARDFPFAITIRQYLYFLYAARIMITAAMGGTVMYLSNKFGRITTIALGVFLLIIPMGLIAMRF